MDKTAETHSRVTNIVNNIKAPPNNSDNGVPQIINESSNFVVVTYWWGRNKDNRNTARPCGDFYEDYIKKVNKFMGNLLFSAISSATSDGVNTDTMINTIFTNLKADPTKFPTLMDMVRKMIKHYMRSVCDHYNVGQKLEDPCKKLFYEEEEEEEEEGAHRPKQSIPPQKTPTALFTLVYDILIDGLIKNKDNLIRLNQLQTEFNAQRDAIKRDKANKIRNDNEILVKNLAEIRLKQTEKIAIQKQLIATLKDKSSGSSIFDQLIAVLEYKAPIHFETMIDQWKKDCEQHGCNHLAVEYPEFAEDGGYQLAINAKPKFIQKALKLCYPRGVLYIDGDMNIRSYPGLFDIENVDFMARGWWIDPRSNWKMTESIMYDPYNFETSGGTMFFASTNAAEKLLHLWTQTAENPINDGKADDRVLSLVFNSKSVLTWIRTIQLPVEYLWLTLDYDERMLLEVYDYDIRKMKTSIFIDHPECLTSEDTASGAGASNDRQPKFYEFLEDVFPCVETTHEYITFKDLVEKNGFSDDKLTTYMQLSDEDRKETDDKLKTQLEKLNTKISSDATHTIHKALLKKERDTIKIQQSETLYLPFMYWYYHYMGGVQYLNDGNADLEDQGFVDPHNEDNEDNAQPLTIISYKDRFGNNPHPSGDGLSVNKVVDINIAYATDHTNDQELISNANVSINDSNHHLTEIIPADDSYSTNKSMIQLVLKYLLQNKSVVINPKHAAAYNPALYNFAMDNVHSLYDEIDFIFYPEIDVTVRRSSFYKPKIGLNQVMLFKPEQRLIDFLSMQLSIEELSLFIYHGSYEFMSLVRVAYLKNQRSSSSSTLPPASPSSPLSVPPPNRMARGIGNDSPSNEHDSSQIFADYFNTFESLFNMPKRAHKRHTVNLGAAPKHHSKKHRIKRKRRNVSRKKHRHPKKHKTPKKHTAPNKHSR